MFEVMLYIMSYIIIGQIVGCIFGIVNIIYFNRSSFDDGDILMIGICAIGWPIALPILIWFSLSFIFGKIVTSIINKISEYKNG